MLVTAEARGKDSHGLIRLPRYIRGIEHGNVDPDGEIEIVRDSGAAATLSGGSRLGPAVAMRAIAEAAARAREHGIGCIGVHDSTHLGLLGYYTDELREENLVGIAMTNTEPAMPPHGGTEPILGTNPIAIGLPTDPPFSLDMSTAAIARGRLETAAERGESIPEGIALDADAEPTTDPEAALEGTILPFGGSKGSGLALAIEVLAGGLVGASMGTGVTGTYHTEEACTKGDCFIAIDPTALGGPDAIARIEAFLEELTTVDPVDSDEAVRLPGAQSLRAEQYGQVTLDRSLWTEISQQYETESTGDDPGTVT
jgi:L-2-hydroxycarboxylate dehydrogenase (NAD+)